MNWFNSFPVFILLLFILIIVLCFVFKVKIDFKSFLKKGFHAKRGNWGIYCFHGAQGKSKTLSLIHYLFNNKNKCIYFCNIPDIHGIDYEFFKGFSGLMDIKHRLDCGDINTYGKQVVIVFDELFLELQKNTKLNSDVMDFLCQMRKRKIIFLTSSQYWSELPLTYRRFCRFAIKCDIINIFPFSIILNKYEDAENMKWSELDQDFVAPLVSTTLYKASKKVADSYNTHQRIEVSS